MLLDMLQLGMCKHDLLDNTLTCHEILGIRDKQKSSLKTFKYGTKLVVAAMNTQYFNFL